MTLEDAEEAGGLVIELKNAEAFFNMLAGADETDEFTLMARRSESSDGIWVGPTVSKATMRRAAMLARDFIVERLRALGIEA